PSVTLCVTPVTPCWNSYGFLRLSHANNVLEVSQHGRIRSSGCPVLLSKIPPRTPKIGACPVRTGGACEGLITINSPETPMTLSARHLIITCLLAVLASPSYAWFSFFKDTSYAKTRYPIV